MNYEENLKKLETILSDMESSNISLNDMMTKYKEAIELYNSLSSYLSEYEQEIKKITKEGLIDFEATTIGDEDE